MLSNWNSFPLAGLLLVLLCCPVRAQSSGDAVVVIYNRDMRQSREVAEYYAGKRQIPRNQLLGLSLPSTETITRGQFTDDLQKPLLNWLVQSGLVSMPPHPVNPQLPKIPAKSKIRYAALCYGVPLKITRDERLKEEGTERLPPELNRNEAAVDSELASLFLLEKLPVAGLFQNPAFSTTNLHHLHPTNGLLMVARLDGPTPEIARGLVDKALEAERDGLWGRAYFDARGTTNKAFVLGDEWILKAADLARLHGWDVLLDKKEETFPPALPVSHIGLYFGWYSSIINGPFLANDVHFMPGAVAYHLHSYSARSIRRDDDNWVGPLLSRGVTATMGCTEEPYLQFTPELHVFLSRLLYLGYTFGEAAYCAQRALSWQTTVIGDPLYRPFSKPPQIQHEELEKVKNPLVEWSQVRIINRNLVQNAPLDEIMAYVQEQAVSKTSAVIQEKMGDVFTSKGKLLDAIDAYLSALKLNPTRPQRLRITLAASWMLASFGRAQEAYDLYKSILEDYPEYPEARTIYRKIADVADSLGKKEEAEDYRKRAGS